ncbi:MAG: hypothetical protein AAF449_20825, partial [Myxococcota bacterium]
CCPSPMRMVSDMRTVYEINLWVHILSGALALSIIVIPLVARKGGALHRRAGWVFTGSMAVVSVTGLIISAAWIVIPLIVKPTDAGASIEEIARYVRSVRVTGLFFALLSFMTAYAVWGGISALRNFSYRAQTVIVFCVPILAVGLSVLAAGVYFGQVVFTIFGSAAASLAARDLLRLRQSSSRTGQERIVAHLNAMLGGATAAATAFTVQVVSRLTDIAVLKIAMWVGPAVLGIGTAAWFARRLRTGRTMGR